MLSENSYFHFSQKIFLAVAVVVSLFAAEEAFRYLNQKDSVDLGFRVTGTQLLLSKKSPYLYKWKEGDDKKFYNQYDIYTGKVNGVTVPPSVLATMIPFTFLETTTTKWVWAFLSYGLILGSIFFFYQLSEGPYKTVKSGFILFFFLGSTAWLLHIERGQQYVVYLFLLSATYFLYKKSHYKTALGVLCILVWLRFPFAILFIPFLSQFRNIKNSLLLITYVILLTGLTFIFSTVQNWKDYFSAVNEWSNAQVIQSTLFSDKTSEVWKTLTIGSIVEESDHLIGNSSLQYLFQYHLTIGLFKSELLALFALSSLLLMYPLRKIFQQKNPDLSFLLAFFLYILFDFFIPAPRYNYTFIQWMFGISLMLTSNKIILKPHWVLLIVLGLLMNMGLFNFIPRSMTIGEFLIFGATWLVLFNNKENRKSVQ